MTTKMTERAAVAKNFRHQGQNDSRRSDPRMTGCRRRNATETGCTACNIRQVHSMCSSSRNNSRCGPEHTGSMHRCGQCWHTQSKQPPKMKTLRILRAAVAKNFRNPWQNDSRRSDPRMTGCRRRNATETGCTACNIRQVHSMCSSSRNNSRCGPEHTGSMHRCGQCWHTQSKQPPKMKTLRIRESHSRCNRSRGHRCCTRSQNHRRRILRRVHKSTCWSTQSTASGAARGA